MKSNLLEEADQILQLIIQKNSEKANNPHNKIKEFVEADLIFKNGNIITMANPIELQLKPESVIVKDGKIVHVGNLDEIVKEKWIGQKTKIIDLKGRTMLPGFIEPHIHFVYAALGHWIDLSPFTHPNMQSVYNAILTAVKEAKKGDWVMCHSYDTFITPGQKLDLSIEHLDSLSNQIPIFVMQSNGHVAHANSAAFKHSNVTKQTPDPPQSKFVKDKNGNLTGRIDEITAINVIQYHSPPLSASQYKKYTHKFFDLASSKGCTSLHDCGIGAYSPQLDYKIIQAVMKDDPSVRFSGFLVAHAAKYWNSINLKPQTKDQLFRINGVKCWSDGSLQAGSGYLKEPYKQLYCGCGRANYSQQQLNQVVLSAHSQGWQIGIHANGDAAIDMALKAYQNAQNIKPLADRRHRIQHCTVCREDQLEKMKKLDVTPSFLIGHVYYYGQYFNDNLLGSERKIDATRSALKNGLKITLHSDYRSQPINPLRCIYNAVTRKSYLSDKIINQQERISVFEAIKAMTIDAAWQCKWDDIVGSIQVGKMADFVVLSEDLLTIDPFKILNVQVLQTWMNGRLRYFKQEQKEIDL